MATVTGTILEPNGVATPREKIEFRLKETVSVSSSTYPADTHHADTGSDGTFSISLVAGDYEVTVKRQKFDITVPAGALSYNIADITTDGVGFPGTIAATFGFFRVSTLAELITIPTRAVNKLCVVLGGTAENDGGGGTFWWDSTGTTADNIYLTRRPTDYTSAGVWRRATDGAYNAQWFGAKPGQNNATAINAAYSIVSAAGGGRVAFPPGSFPVNSQITVRTGVSLIGSGEGVTFLDYTASTATDYHMLGQGSLVALPALATAITAGDTTITFASAPSLSAGDVFLIENDVDNSYMTVGDGTIRPYYHAGEHFRVHSVSGSVVTVTASALSDYALGADRKLFKLTPITGGIHGMSMRFRQGLLGDSTQRGAAGIWISMGRGFNFSNLDLSGSNWTQIALDRCVECSLSNIRGVDFQDSVGNNYIITLANCWRISATDCHLESTRHSWTMGGVANLDGQVPNRFISVTGGTIAGGSAASAPGFDGHGNCEFVTVTGVNLPNGLGYGGDYWTITGCTIGNAFVNATAILSGEPKGNTFTIENNTIIVSRHFGNGLIAHTPRSCTDRAGALKISGNNIDMRSFRHPTSAATKVGAVTILTEVAAGTTDVSVIIENNTFRSDLTTTAQLYAIDILPNAARELRNLVIQNNSAINCGLRLGNNVNDAMVAGNTVLGANEHGIYVAFITAASASAKRWFIQNNYVRNAYSNGIDIRGNNTDRFYVNRNHSANNGRGGTGGTSLQTSIRIATALEATLIDNVIGDDQATATPPTQASTYAVDGITHLTVRGNHNVGQAVNTLAPVISSVSNNYSSTFARTGGTSAPDSDLYYATGEFVANQIPAYSMGWMTVAGGQPATFVKAGLLSTGDLFDWNETDKTIGIGIAAVADPTIKLKVDRNANALTRVYTSNPNTGSAAGVVHDFVGGNGSGFIGLFTEAYGTTEYRDAFVFGANSSLTKLVVSGQGASQVFEGHLGSLTTTFRFDGDSTAGNTRFLIYDATSGVLERVQSGANDSGGAGKRVLVINNA